MKILILTAPDQDYGADYLHHGFCELAGSENTIDWPPKDSLHSHSLPVFDCDQAWPRHGLMGANVESMLAGLSFDLIVVPTLRGTVPAMLRDWARRGVLDDNRERIVAYDCEDFPHNSSDMFASALGAPPAAYFKRELPIGATWAKPLPFSYPESRIVPVGDRTPSVGYIVERWDWAVGGVREWLGAEIKEAFGDAADVKLTHNGNRLSVTEYHERMRRCSVAVVPAGAGYNTNRHLDVIANGSVPVMQAPTIQLPDWFTEGVEAEYFRTANEAVAAVRTLFENPGRALAMAEAAQAKLRAHHTTRCRAETVWRAVHGESR